jgi:hypothetical protein
VKVLILAITLSILLQGCGGAGGGGAGSDDLSLLQLDFSDPYKPSIVGVVFECTDFENRRVVFAADTSIADVGISLPATVLLNPLKLAAMPPALQYFWVGHECAHHSHRGSNEVEADCISIAAGKQRTLFTRRDVEAFEPWFIDKPGSTRGHLPGPLRHQNLLACYDAG